MNELKEMNLYQRLLKIQSELPVISKNLEIEFKKGSKYKAVGEIDVLLAIKPLEDKYGVYSHPIDRDIIITKEITTSYGTVNQYMLIKTTYEFVNVDMPEEKTVVVSLGEGVDSQDKASGKAQTYSDKYALLKAYKAATGEDPDQEASQEHISNMISKGQIELIETLYDVATITTKILPYYKVKALNELTKEQGDKVIKRGNDKA